MKLTATKYFQNAGYVDAIRGNTMAHIASLPDFAKIAYARGQSLATPKVYSYRLNRSVGEYKSGTVFTHTHKLPSDSKGKVEVSLNGQTVQVPFSRLTLA